MLTGQLTSPTAFQFLTYMMLAIDILPMKGKVKKSMVIFAIQYTVKAIYLRSCTLLQQPIEKIQVQCVNQHEKTAIMYTKCTHITVRV